MMPRIFHTSIFTSTSLKPLLCGLTLSLLLTLPCGAFVVHLDFDGHHAVDDPVLKKDHTAPAFTGSIADQIYIRESLEEDFAPFDVMFSFREPELPDNRWIRVVLGGDTSDLEGSVRGLANPPQDSNTVWVSETSAGVPIEVRITATNVSHQLGHAFGFLAVAQPLGEMPGSYLSHYTPTGSPNNPAHDLSGQGKKQIMGQHPGRRAVVEE